MRLHAPSPPQGKDSGRSLLFSLLPPHIQYSPAQTFGEIIIGADLMAYEPDNWFDATFLQRIPLTIRAGQVPSTQTDFQLVINDTYFELVGQTIAQLRFAGEDDIQLDYEIQEFNPANGKLIAWIKKPSVSDGDIIYIYFDNLSAVDEQNPSAVWSDYNAVYHMSQLDPLAQGILDSTVNDNDGTVVGSPTVVTGKIGNAFRTNTNGVITVPNSVSMDIGVADFSVEAWVEVFETTDINFGFLRKKFRFNGGHIGWQFFFDFRNANVGFQPRLNDGTQTNDETFGFPGSRALLQNNGLHHVAFSYDSSAKLLFSYIDGVQNSGDNFLGTTGNFSNNEDFKFTVPLLPDVTMDEVRLSTVVKTPDFIETSFNNQNDQALFYTTDAAESVPSPSDIMAYEPDTWFNLLWQKRITLTIQPGKVPSPQIDFPLLINGTFSDLVGEVEAELRFAGVDNVQLDYEIQEFDSGTGLLIAWIKKPLVSDGDEIRIYFDNPLATDEQNPFDLWSDYNAVYHMNQGNFNVEGVLDSTVNANTGSVAVGASSVTGKIGKALRTNANPITIADSPSVDVGLASFSLEGWVETFDVPFLDYGLMEKKLAENDSNQGWAFRNDFRADDRGFQFRLNDGTHPFDEDFNITGSRTVLQLTGFHYLVVTYNSSSKVIREYIDGVFSGLPQNYTRSGNFINSLPLIFGGLNTPDDIFDEFRLSTVVKSDDFIATSFNNQDDPGTFYSVGPLELPPTTFDRMEYDNNG